MNEFEKELNEKIISASQEGLEGVKKQVGEVLMENANLYASMDKLKSWARELYEENQRLKEQINKSEESNAE